MTGELKKLIEEFKRISSKKWIPSVNQGTGSIGLTFENELKKKADSLYLPDYYGIELKCTTRFSRFPFSLFSIAFDGPTFPEIDRLVNLYGYEDYKFHDKKVLNVDLNTIEIVKKNNYMYKLFLDKDDKKLYLEVYDLEKKLIERKSFVYLDSILNRLNIKLRNLAIIHGSKKIVDEEEFFRYYSLDIYKLKENMFIKMLEEGKIIVTLESRVGKSGLFEGKYKNKNLVFKLKREFLEELFVKIFTLNTDYCINRLIEPSSNFFIFR